MPLNIGNYRQTPPKSNQAKEKNYRILEIRELGHNAAIINYLESRTPILLWLFTEKRNNQS